jgi:predicted ATPase
VAGATRARMLRELAEAIEAVTAERPLVLWLEDLHWSQGDCIKSEAATGG